MPVKSQIVGPNGNAATVGPEGELSVTVHPHPPVAETIYSIPFYQYLTDDGTSGGSNDMIINGATTPTEFFIKAQGDEDIHIKRINFLISDAGAELDEFGGLAALTNGVEFFYETGETGRASISEDLKTNLQVVRLSGGNPSFGSGADAFRFLVSGAGAESYMTVIDFEATFGLTWGMRLRKKTGDKIGFKVQDAMAGIATMNAFATGFQLS